MLDRLTTDISLTTFVLQSMGETGNRCCLAFSGEREREKERVREGKKRERGTHNLNKKNTNTTHYSRVLMLKMEVN